MTEIQKIIDQYKDVAQDLKESLPIYEAMDYQEINDYQVRVAFIDIIERLEKINGNKV